jgi:apolipoprotein N-acyltransferase
MKQTSAPNQWIHHHKVSLTFWGLMALSTICLALPFLKYSWGAVSLISLVPFFLLIEFLTQHSNPRQRLLFIYLVGFGSMLYVLFWSTQTNPQQWAYIRGWVAPLSVYLNYLLFAGFFALNFLIFSGLYYALKIKMYSYRALLLIPSLWVISEYLRSWLFSIFVFGHGATIGAYWDFGNLGVAASTTLFGFAGRFIGLYGFTFMAVLSSLLVTWAIRKKNVWPLLTMLILALGISLAGHQLYRPSTANPQKIVAFVQTPPSFTGLQTDNQKLDQTLHELPVNHQLAVLVLPEHAELLNRQNDPDFNHRIEQALEEQGSVVSSRLTSNEANAVNQLRIYDSHLQPVFSHNKSFLVPIGEYMPYLHQGLLTLLKQQDALDQNYANRDLGKDRQAIPAVSRGDLILGAQVCSGAVAPQLFQRQVKAGAQILTNSASISMFSTAGGYQEQSKQFAHFIAQANARPYVQSAEGGHGFIINSDGHALVNTNNYGYAYGAATVILNTTRTIYSQLGEWVVPLSGIVTSLFIAQAILRWYTTRYKHKDKNG